MLPNVGGGGVQRVLLNLAEELARRGQHVSVVALGPLPTTAASSTTLEVVTLSGSNPLSKIKLLTELLRERRVDVLLAGITRANLAALVAGALARRGVTTILTKHLPLERLSDSAWRRVLLRAVIAVTYGRADAVVAVSEGTLTSLRSLGIRPRRLVRIANPVIPDDLDLRLSSVVEHDWFRPGSPPVILAAGRLTKQKGFDVLLRAFALLLAEREARLVILGEGEQRSELAAVASDLGIEGSVSLPGHVPDALPYMARAAVFVLSSRWEGLPTVLVEAMAAGATVVSSDCPVGPKELLAGGALGALVPVDDPTALAAAISKAMDDPRPVPRHVLEPYTASYAADCYLTLIDEVRVGH